MLNSQSTLDSFNTSICQIGNTIFDVHDETAIRVFISRAGVATGLVSVPLRYMHSPIETLDLDDLENAVRLVVAFALRLEPGLSFAC